MGQKINVGAPIDLQSLLDTRALIQAGSGGGKSYMLRKLIESVGDKVPQIILDPEGEFVTLREKFDFALVSRSGDIPLNLKYAETLAHKILETNLSVIIDLYELKKHERVLFVKRFLDALMNSPKELWHPVLVYVDEAHIFCPESTKSESADAVIDLCTRGRKRGFAAVLATQRLSKLHKDAAAECLNKMIGRTGLDIDRKRAGDELGMISKQQMLGLRDLEVGEFYAFGPAISNEVLKFKTAKVVTTHPKAGKRVAKIPPTPGAIKKIISKLQDIPEEAEKELKTKQEFIEKIRSLERQLRDQKRTLPKPGKETLVDGITPLKQEIQILRATIKEKDGQIKDAVAQYNALEKSFQLLQKVSEDTMQKGIMLIKSIIPPTKKEIIISGSPIKVGTTVPKQDQQQYRGLQPVNKSAAVKKEQIVVINDDHLANGSLDKGPHTLLKVIASLHPQQVSRQRLSMLSGYSLKSSTFAVHVSTLNTRRLIEKTGDGYTITEEGLKAVGDYEPVPTDSDTVIEFWINKLDAGPAKMLKILCDHWPNSISRQQLSEQSGYSMSSSTFAVHISTLFTLKLITKPQGMLKASDALFQ